MKTKFTTEICGDPKKLAAQLHKALDEVAQNRGAQPSSAGSNGGGGSIVNQISNIVINGLDGRYITQAVTSTGNQTVPIVPAFSAVDFGIANAYIVTASGQWVQCTWNPANFTISSVIIKAPAIGTLHVFILRQP